MSERIDAPEHWAVTVSRSGDEIVTIESNCLSGREISAEDEETIRCAAHSLLGFIAEDRANALLIAVTPEMYELTLAVAAYFDGRDADAPLGKQARAILAKLENRNG